MDHLLHFHGSALSELSTTLALDSLSGPGDDLILRLEHELDVAGGGHEVLGSAVSTEATSSTAGGTVDLDVGNEEGIYIQVAHVSVGLGVPEKVQDEPAGLLGPSRRGALVLLALGVVSGAT